MCSRTNGYALRMRAVQSLLTKISGNEQWRIYIQKFLAHAPPPTGPNSFVFTYVFTEKHLCQGLAPPPTGLAPPPMGNPGSAPDEVKSGIRH